MGTTIPVCNDSNCECQAMAPQRHSQHAILSEGYVSLEWQVVGTCSHASRPPLVGIPLAFLPPWLSNLKKSAQSLKTWPQRLMCSALHDISFTGNLTVLTFRPSFLFSLGVPGARESEDGIYHSLLSTHGQIPPTAHERFQRMIRENPDQGSVPSPRKKPRPTNEREWGGSPTAGTPARRVQVPVADCGSSSSLIEKFLVSV